MTEKKVVQQRLAGSLSVVRFADINLSVIAIVWWVIYPTSLGTWPNTALSWLFFFGLFFLPSEYAMGWRSGAVNASQYFLCLRNAFALIFVSILMVVGCSIIPVALISVVYFSVYLLIGAELFESIAPFASPDAAVPIAIVIFFATLVLLSLAFISPRLLGRLYREEEEGAGNDNALSGVMRSFSISDIRYWQGPAMIWGAVTSLIVSAVSAVKNGGVEQAISVGLWREVLIGTVFYMLVANLRMLFFTGFLLIGPEIDS